MFFFVVVVGEYYFGMLTMNTMSISTMCHQARLKQDPEYAKAAFDAAMERRKERAAGKHVTVDFKM